LEKESAPALKDWAALDPAEKDARLADERFLRQEKNLGLSLWLLAVDGAGLDEGRSEARRQDLLGRAAASAPHEVPAAPAGDEARLRKKLAAVERKLHQAESVLAREREAHKSIKRDLIQRKGELAESRMLAERLRAELDQARATARLAPARESRADAAGAGLGELERSLRKLATEQQRLTKRLGRLPADAGVPVAPESKTLGPLGKTLAGLREELAALRQESADRDAAQQKRLAELGAALRGAPAARRGRRHRPTAKSERVGVFVDVQNVYYAARKLKGKLDFDALLRAAVKERRLIRATAYVVESKETDQSQFIARLEKLALDVKRKTVQTRADGSMKGDWDMELALDILEMVPKLDVVVLVSGDGDFTSLVKRVKSAGPRVEVIAFPRHTAKSLVEAADEFQPLDRKFMIYPKRTRGRTDGDDASAETATASPTEATGLAAEPSAITEAG
jgi:uncharacterized LabA/DUF88 family protein